MQTKLGAKINLLIDRITDLWSGNAGKKAQNSGQVKVTQPLAGGAIVPQHMPSQADVLNMPQNMNPGNTTLIADLPVAQGQQTNNQVPQMDIGPMAANEALGGGFGSMW